MTVTVTDRTPVRIDPLTDQRWNRLTQAGGGLFSSTRWLRVLADGYGLEFSAEVFGDESNPRGGVVWADINDLRGRRMSSLPFSDFTDPVGAVDIEEFAGVVADLTGGGAPFSVRLRAGADWAEELSDTGVLAERGRLAWHRTELPADESELWTSLKSGARQNVRKAQRNDLEVSVDATSASVAGFRRLHVGLRKSKYRMLAQPHRFFDALASEFGPDDLRVVTAADDGEIVAGVVLLRHGDTAYYKFNASTSDGLALRANDIVMWTAMQEAISWGCSWFDFGVSDLDQPGLIRYKRKYASEECEVVVLRRDAALPPTRVANGVGRVLPLLTRALTDARCPDAITSRAGDLLYRHFC